MIETGFQIIDAIINNPLEAVILFALVFFSYKYFFGRRGSYNRHVIISELEYKIKMAYYNLFEKSNSYAGLKPEYFDDVLHLISKCPTVNHWSLQYFLRAKLQLNYLDMIRIMVALRNLEKIEVVNESWRIKNV